MIIDIKKTILRKSISRFIVLVVVAIVMCVLLFDPFTNDLIKGIRNSMLGIFLALAWLIYSAYEWFRNYNYIYFNDESDKIVLRYFSPTIFTAKKNSIEIPKREFAEYKLESFFLGYRENIILLRRTQKGKAGYPPVSITALNPHEKHDLLISLEKAKQQS
jgi:hypothetical protein